MCSLLLFRVSFFIAKHLIAATIDVTMIQWLKLVIMEHSFQVKASLCPTLTSVCLTVCLTCVSRPTRNPRFLPHFRESVEPLALVSCE